MKKWTAAAGDLQPRYSLSVTAKSLKNIIFNAYNGKKGNIFWESMN